MAPLQLKAGRNIDYVLQLHCVSHSTGGAAVRVELADRSSVHLMRGAV
jgi:hypothetical protein